MTRSGNALATAPGTPNSVFALPIQGVTSGTPVPMSAAALPLPTGAATFRLANDWQYGADNDQYHAWVADAGQRRFGHCQCGH